MTRSICRSSAVLVLVAGVALLAGADKKKKKKEAVNYIVTSKELGEEFGASAARAQRKYAAGKNAPAAKLDVDGVVKSVDEKESTVTLVGTDKVAVILKAKKITGEKEGKRIAIAKGAAFKEFTAKPRQVILECSEVKLEKYPDVKE